MSIVLNTILKMHRCLYKKGSRMGERIAKKIGKGFLWLIKLGFVLLCLLIWWWCISLAESIIPAFYDQCVYHEFAENFLREKYGEDINVHNERLPLSELNAGRFMDYEYNFRLHGKKYQFLYYKTGSDDGDFYGDNAQYDEIYQLVDDAIDKVRYNSTISGFDRIGWRFSQDVAQPGYALVMTQKMIDAMFTSKYTGDNLHEFPICIVLYWDKETAFDGNQKKLEEMYKSVTEDLALYDVACKEIYIYKDGKDYHITETSKGIKIEED